MCARCVQGLEDPQLIFQVVPEGLSGRKFAPPSAGMRVHYLPRRGRFNVASSFVSGTSASGDSGNSSSGHMLPLKLRHLLNLPSQTALVSSLQGTWQCHLSCSCTTVSCVSALAAFSNLWGSSCCL